MAAIDLIIELLWRAYLFLALLYVLDYALDGKLDLPGKEVDWEDLRIAKWLDKLWRKLKNIRRVE